MSNPFRDHIASKKADEKNKIKEKFTPIVLWIKTPGNTHEVRNYLTEELYQMPYVDVADGNVPWWFATDGTKRAGDVNGDTDE